MWATIEKFQLFFLRVHMTESATGVSTLGSFEKKLASYVIAGGAALMATATPLEAAIITIVPGVTPGAPATAPTLTVATGEGQSQLFLDIDLDGVDDVYFELRSEQGSAEGTPTLRDSVFVFGQAGNLITGFNFDATRFASPTDALAMNPTLAKAKLLSRYTTFGEGDPVVSFTGNWLNGESGILGVEFMRSGTPTRGFIDATVVLGSATVTLNQWGYQTNDVPEPSTMAMFALGAAGIAALRRRRVQ
ncbi:MAG: PEP-CTERM sorting domain-containing protein [Bryobacterales bacterium]|nr:PEP-CTERM sorting domain-containing protein [Bryobacterales bacterium]